MPSVEFQGLGCPLSNGCPASKGVFGRFFAHSDDDDVFAIAFEDTPTDYSLAVTDIDCDDISCGYISADVTSATGIPIPTGLTSGTDVLLSVRSIASIVKLT